VYRKKRTEIRTRIQLLLLFFISAKTTLYCLEVAWSKAIGSLTGTQRAFLGCFLSHINSRIWV